MYLTQTMVKEHGYSIAC